MKLQMRPHPKYRPDLTEAEIAAAEEAIPDGWHVSVITDRKGGWRLFLFQDGNPAPVGWMASQTRSIPSRVRSLVEARAIERAA